MEKKGGQCDKIGYRKEVPNQGVRNTRKGEGLTGIMNRLVAGKNRASATHKEKIGGRWWHCGGGSTGSLAIELKKMKKKTRTGETTW